MLNVELAELFRKIQSAERMGKRLTEPAALKEFFKQATLQVRDVTEGLELDVT